MDSPRYEVAGPVEDDGIVVRGLRVARGWAGRVRQWLRFGPAVVCFFMFAATVLIFVESLVAEYAVGDMQQRVFLPGLVLVVVGLPASLQLHTEQLSSVGRLISRLLFWWRTNHKRREPLLPRWVRRANWVLGTHAMVNFVLTLHVTGGGWVKESSGRYFAVQGDRTLRVLKLEEAQLWLSFWVSAFAATYVLFFFAYGFTYWCHRERLAKKQALMVTEGVAST